jgi:glycosyltransferase involved in cell wall biosynthesis
MVSVITPVLNQRGYIAGTVRSVLEQDHPNIDYIVIDGGSTDGTLEILEQYRDHIRLISEPDGGQANAINKGLRLAEGEIMAWLNADDALLPGAIGEIARAFAADPGVVCVYGDCNYIDSRGRVLSRYPARPFDLRSLVVHSENFIPQPAAFFRKVCLDSAGYLDETLDYVLDYELWLRFSQVGKFKYLPKELAHLRLHSGAKSVAAFASFGDELVAVIEDYFNQPGLLAELQHARQEAISRANLRAAHAAFWAGEMDAARHYSQKARWEHMPIKPRITRMYIQWLSALNRRGIPVANLVRRSSRNPYTLYKSLGDG